MSSILYAAGRAARQSGDLQGLIDAVPYARFLGIRSAAPESSALLQLPFREGLVGNPALPAIHGGVTAAFMENAALLCLLLRLDVLRMPKSVDFAIDYLRSGRPLTLYADAEISRVGSRVAHVSVRCWQDQIQQPIALARGHFLLEPAPESA